MTEVSSLAQAIEEDLERAIAGGLFPGNSHSQAFEAFRIVKAGPGTLYGFSGYSSRVSSQWIQVFDLKDLPADGAAPHCAPVIVSASSNFSVDYGYHGRRFSRGIIICNSTTAPTKTLGAADCYIDAQYV